MIQKLYLLNLKALGLRFAAISKTKASINKILLVILAAACIAVSVAIAVAGLFHGLLVPLFSAGIGWMYFSFLAIIVFGLCVIGTIFAAQAQFFGANDNELLLSMPIKPAEILISRLLVLLTFEYVYTAIIALPASIVWLRSEYGTVAGAWRLGIMVLFLPLMAMTVSLLLAWLLNIVTLHMPHKNVITLVLSIGFLIAYLYVSYHLQGYLSELIRKGSELADAFRAALPPFYAFGIGVTEHNIQNMISFLLWAAVPFLTELALLAVDYRKMLISNHSGTKAVYKERTIRAGSALTALIRKELAHYWSKPFVILNTSSGSLFMLVLSVMLSVKKADVLLYMNTLTPSLGNLPPAAFSTAVLVFLGAANNTSASLISLEGKNLWIAQSLPLPPETIIRSKVAMHLLVSGLPCLAASVCTAAVLAENAADWFMLILLPCSACMLIAAAGTAINLLFPKLEWKNEIYVVKQGLSVIILLFGTMGAFAGLGAVYVFFLQPVLSFTAFLWLCAAIFAAAAALTYIWLMKSGVKKLAGLSQ